MKPERTRIEIAGGFRGILIAAVLLLLSGLPAVGKSSIGSSIETLLCHKNLGGASIGVEIRSLETGETLYSLNPRRPLIVASNNKLISTASALYHLGEDFRFETALFSRGPVFDGVLDGDLVVKGGGNPGVSGRFYNGDPLKPMEILAGYVKDAGIELVTGNLVLDDTVFDRVYTAPGWPDDQLVYYYCAPVSGLSYLENVLHVSVTPASTAGRPAIVTLFPPGAPYTAKGTIKTVSGKTRNTIHFGRPGPEGVLRVRGEIAQKSPTWEGKVSVLDPPLYFGAVFREVMRRKGIVVRGGTVKVETPFDEGARECRRMGALETSLKELILITNKESHNNIAGHLFKMAGWKVRGTGSFGSGAEAVGLLFDELGLDDADPFVIVDGSGLSRGNRFSARTIVALLEGVYSLPIRDTYLRSFPVSGADGSLKKRLTEKAYRLRVRAKTGWIREVSAFSGYLQSASGEVFAFSILFNGYKGLNARMKKIQDDICRVIVDRA